MDAQDLEAGIDLAVRVERGPGGAGGGAVAAIVLRNVGRAPWTIVFPSSQRFDLALVDGGGRERWRWSEGRAFAMMLAEETLEAGEGREWREPIVLPRDPGRWRLVATVPGFDPPLTAAAVIEVAE